MGANSYCATFLAAIHNRHLRVNRTRTYTPMIKMNSINGIVSFKLPLIGTALRDIRISKKCLALSYTRIVYVFGFNNYFMQYIRN